MDTLLVALVFLLLLMPIALTNHPNKAIAQNMTSSVPSKMTKASPGLIVPVHVTNGGGTVCVHSKKQDLGCKNASGESTLQFVFTAGSLAPDEMFTVCIKGNPKPHCIGNTLTPPSYVAIESDSGSTAIAPGIVPVQDTTTSGDTSWKEFGVFLGPIQKHTGVFHNENGVFIPWKTLCGASQSYLLESCSSLINTDGSLTSAGDKAVGCITNGAIITAAASQFNLPLDTIKGILGGLAEPTGCSGIVNMDQIQTSPDLQRLVKFAGTMAH